MSLGDGVVWNEALPDNQTVAHQIDDYDRDLRVGVRSRMDREHVWPSSQTATNEGGHHRYITFQAQTGAPVMAGTTAGALYVTTGTKPSLIYVASDGSSTTLVNTSGRLPSIMSGGTQGSIVICSSGADYAIIPLAASAPGLVLHTNTNTGAPTWEKINLSSTSQVTGSPTAMLGAWESKLNDTVYQAPTDGFVVVRYGFAGGSYEVLSDSANPPTTLRGYASGYGASSTTTVPIKKGDYWKVSTSGMSPTTEWIPIGS